VHVTLHTLHPTHTLLIARLTLCSMFDLLNGRLVLVFSLDSMIPVTSIALLPVELSTFHKPLSVLQFSSVTLVHARLKAAEQLIAVVIVKKAITLE
jgi:hypothetical protein